MKYFIVFVALVAISCDKGDYVSATVYDYGEPALDGCGWVVEVGDEIYKPTNLVPELQKDRLVIQIDFDKLNSRANCGLMPDAFQEIKINKTK